MAKRILGALLGVLVLSTLGASAAQASQAPEAPGVYCYPYWPITVCCDAASCWVQRSPR